MTQQQKGQRSCKSYKVKRKIAILLSRQPGFGACQFLSSCKTKPSSAQEPRALPGDSPVFLVIRVCESEDRAALMNEMHREDPHAALSYLARAGSVGWTFSF